MSLKSNPSVRKAISGITGVVKLRSTSTSMQQGESLPENPEDYQQPASFSQFVENIALYILVLGFISVFKSSELENKDQSSRFPKEVQRTVERNGISNCCTRFCLASNQSSRVRQRVGRYRSATTSRLTCAAIDTVESSHDTGDGTTTTTNPIYHKECRVKEERDTRQQC